MHRTLIAAATLLAVQNFAEAQTPNRQTGNTQTGNQQTQSGSGTQGNGQSFSFGSGQAGQSSLFGSGQLSANGNGTSGLSQNASQPFEFGQLGQQVRETTGFVGAPAQNGFVGNRLANEQAGARSALQQAFQSLSRGGGGARNSQLGASKPKLGIRPTLKVAFRGPTATPAIATTRVSTRMSRIVGRRPELAGVTASADDTGRVVLRGSVANDEARELAAALVRLEPGVGEVVNELAVGSETAP